MIEQFPFAPSGQTTLTGSPEVPLHVGIVPDGNRRWSHRTGASITEAYVVAAGKALEAAIWCHEAGVRHLSAFALSQENVAMRPSSDVAAILPALELFCSGVRGLGYAHLHLFGDRASLLQSLPRWSAVLDLDDGPPLESPPLTVHVGVNYSGQGELLALVQTLRDIGIRGLDRSVLTLVPSGQVPALDLLIRSGGQQRLSGFLPFQTAYAELWFTSTLWPDFQRADFDAALRWYACQERRLGE